MKLLMFLLFFIIFISTTQNSFSASEKFGNEFTLTNVESNESINQKISRGEKHFLLTGKVEQVCQKKGCWMKVKTDFSPNNQSEPMRVTFKDYGFFVPVSLMGKKVLMEGQLIEKEVSVKDLRHFAKDAGATKEEIKKITTAKNEWQFVVAALKTVEDDSKN